MKLQEQAEQYLKQAVNRKRNSIGHSTTMGYASYIQKWIIPELGHLELIDVKPSTVKPLVEKMTNNGLSASTITLVIGRVKAIMKSAVDEEGEPLYPRKWNNDFMDVPVIDKTEQKAPILPLNALQESISKALGQDKALYIMLAASGARISELRSLKAKSECDTDSYWEPDKSIIHIRSTFSKEVYKPWTKTDAGIRDIDLHPDVNTYLKQADLPKEGWLFKGIDNPNSHYLLSTADRRLKELGVSTGFHSFRRFRITHLESQNVPNGLQRYWTGHSARDIHESYIKMGEKIELRKEWAERPE